MPSERQTLQLYIIHGTVLDLLLLIVTCIELNRAHRCAACPALHLLYCLGSRTRKNSTWFTNSGLCALRDRPRPGWLKGLHHLDIVIICGVFNKDSFHTLWYRSQRLDQQASFQIKSMKLRVCSHPEWLYWRIQNISRCSFLEAAIPFLLFITHSLM